MQEKYRMRVKVEIPSTEEDSKNCFQHDLLSVQKQLLYESEDKKHLSCRAKQHDKGSLQTLYTFQEALHYIREEEKATGMHYIGHRKEGVFDKDGEKSCLCV